MVINLRHIGDLRYTVIIPGRARLPPSRNSGGCLTLPTVREEPDPPESAQPKAVFVLRVGAEVVPDHCQRRILSATAINERRACHRVVGYGNFADIRQCVRKTTVGRGM